MFFFRTAAMAVLSCACVSALAQSLSFDIPAQPLSSALHQFGRQAGLTIMMAQDMVANRQAPALKGEYTIRAGLDVLLTGSGLTADIEQGVVTLRQPHATNNGRQVSQLSAVRIQASGIPFANSATTDTISRQQLDRFTATNAGDMFRDVPGITAANSRSGASLDLNIRGLQGMGRVKIMVDGTQSSSTDYRGYAGHHSHTYVDPELLGKVTIEKGPNAGPYGAGATAGVVSMDTLNASDLITPGNRYGIRLRGTWGNRASGGDAGGSDGHGQAIADRNISASAAGAWHLNDTLALVLGLSQRRSGNYTAGTRDSSNSTTATGDGSGGYYTISPYQPGREVNNTSQDMHSGLLKANLSLPHRQTLDLGLVQYDNRFGSPRTTVGDFYTRQLRLSHTRKTTYHARYAWKPESSWIDLRANLWMAQANEFRANDYERPGQDQAQEAQSRSHGVEVWNTSLLALPWLQDVSLRYGATWLREKTDITELRATNTGLDPSGSRDLSSVFLQFEAQPYHWLQLHGGIRREHYRLKGSTLYPSSVLGQAKTLGQFDDSDSRINPSLGITLTPWGQQTAFFARYSEGWRPATVKETVNSYDPATRPYLLKPEFSRNLEIGVHLSREGLIADTDRGTLQLTLFNTHYENYITGGLGNFWNIDGARYRGIELNLDYDAGWLFLKYGLTRYLKVQACDTNVYGWATRPPGVTGGCSENEYTGGNLLEFGGINPPPRFQHSLTLGARLLEQRLTLGLRITDVGERAMKKIYPDGRQGYDAGWAPYTIYDLFASYRVNRHLSLNASVENLHDRFYIEASTNPLSAVPAPGRTAKISVTYQF